MKCSFRTLISCTALVCVLLSPSVAYPQGAVSQTPLVGLSVPATGSSSWQVYINQDLYLLDNLLGGATALPSLDITGNLTVGGTLSVAGVTPTAGTYGSSTQCAVITVNASGLISSASQVACAGGGGSGSVTLTGDVTGSGTGSVATTLATVNSNVGTFGTSSACASFTVNAKGLVTAASQSTNCPGSSGTAISGTVKTEVPSGAINGTNPTFTISQTPSPANIQLYKNGLLQAAGGTDYSLSGTTITFVTASIPQSGDTLAAWYTYGTGGGGSGNATTVNGAAVPNNSVIVSNGSGQLVNGNAAVLNTNNRAVFRDWQNALDLGNYSTNGIATGITNCGSSPCVVFSPADYPATEAMPCISTNWYNFTPGTTCTLGNSTMGMDERFGFNLAFHNPQGQGIGNNSVPMQWNIVNDTPNYALSHIQQNNFGLNFSQENRDGGVNINQLTYGNKSNWNVMSLKMQSITSGQHIVFGGENATGGMGDTLFGSVTNETAGGVNAGTDEGNEFFDYHGGTPAGSYAATLTAVSGTTLTMTAYQMPDTQGQDRSVIDLNSAHTITTGTVSFISPSASAPETVYFSGVSLPTPTVQAQLGTAVAGPGTYTVTPTSYVFGSIAGITTSTMIVVADIGGIDFIKPTSVSGSSFTAVFRYPHASTAIIQVGGLAGYGLDLTADDITTANSATAFPSVPPVGTVRRIWAIISNSASSGSPISFYCTVTPCTSALIYNSSGGWNPIISQYQNLSGLNGYVLYPMAYAVQAFDGGYVSGNSGSRNPDSMVVTPSNTAWTVGDNIEETMGPINRVSMGIWEVHGYQPAGAFNASGSGIAYSIPLQGSDTLWGLTNNWPDCAYGSDNAGSSCPSGHAGTFLGPTMISMTGKHQFAITINEPGDYGEINVSCPPSPQICNFYDTFLKEQNSTNLFDSVVYSQSQSSWNISSGTGSSAILVMIPHSGAAGTGYAVGDTFSVTQTGASGGKGVVTAIGASGAVTYASVNGQTNHGTGYSVATGLSTTTLTGSGSGLQVDISQTEGTNTGFTPLWFASNTLMLANRTLAQTPGCTSEFAGALAQISDSQSSEPGAVITGGGSNKALAYCQNNLWVNAAGIKPTGTTSVTNHSGTLSSTIVCVNNTQCTAGNYTVTLPFVINSTSTSGTIVVSVSYGDGYSYRTYPIWTITDSGVTGSVPTQNYSIHSDGSQNISISATSSGSTVYSLYPTVTLQ